MTSADESAGPSESVNPYLFVWLNPRGAVRSYLNRNPRTSLWLIVLIAVAAQNGLKLIGSAESIGLLIAVVGVASAIYAAFLYFIYARLLTFVCHSLKGLGELRETRAALAWSEYVRAILTAVVFLATLAAISATGQPQELALDATAVVAVSAGLGVAAWVYTIVLTSLLIAESHEFAWWKGLLSAVLTRVLLSVMLLATMIVLMMVVTAAHI